MALRGEDLARVGGAPNEKPGGGRKREYLTREMSP